MLLCGRLMNVVYVCGGFLGRKAWTDTFAFAIIWKCQNTRGIDEWKMAFPVKGNMCACVERMLQHEVGCVMKSQLCAKHTSV